MKHQSVPCETCLGTGKRAICLHENQAVLPLSVLSKATQIFSKCTVEESHMDGFVLELEAAGTYEDINQKVSDFHSWIDDNFPREVGGNIVCIINRIELKEI